MKIKHTYALPLFALCLAACSKQQLSNPAATLAASNNLAVNSTNIVVTQPDPYLPVLDDGFGYNTEFPETAEPWSSNSSQNTNAFISTNANCVRYPGGTIANYWDAYHQEVFLRKHSTNPNKATGWVDAALLNPTAPVYNTVLNDLQQVNSLVDLHDVVSKSGCSVVFVLNMVTPGKDYYASADGWNRTVTPHPPSTNGYTTPTTDDWYKMLDDRYLRIKRMLLDAKAQSIPIRYVELGNELYYGGDAQYHTEAFPAGEDYAIAANYLVGKLKADAATLGLASDVKFSFVGSGVDTDVSQTRIVDWNEHVTNKISATKLNYADVHNYADVTPVIGDGSFNNTNVKSNADNWINRVHDIFTQDHYYQYLTNQSWYIWFTELRAMPQSTSIWARNLLEAYSALHAIDLGGVLYMQPNFSDVISGLSLKSRAYAFLPVMRASRDATQAKKLYFPGSGYLTGTSTRTVLQGYMFKTPAGVKKCAIVSFSENIFTLNLVTNGILVSGNATVSSYDNTNLNDNSATGVTKTADHTETASSITIKPYSVTYIQQ